MKKLLPVLLFCFTVIFQPKAYSQVIDPFAPVFSQNAQGDIYLIGNTNLKCSAASGCCNSSINNNESMINADVDSDGSTFNSSSANFTLPPGASVLWAGLYWGGSGNGSASANQIKFKVPGAVSYTTITGALTTSSYGFSAYKDVTSIVQAAGSGTYTGANIQLATGSNRFGGWSLVIVTQDPSLPFRNLTVNDGFVLVSSSNPNQTITPSGFTTPIAGPVNAQIGVVAFDGDNGVVGGQYKGDRLKLNGTDLFDALNPADDFFNSSITRLGTNLTARNPNCTNTLGVDIDVVNATGYIPNGATSATINLTTGGESYIPIVVTSVIELFAPQIVTGKSQNDLNGGDLKPGDIIEYTVVMTNTGKDIAANFKFIDTIPAYTTYVPGSLQITAGPNSGAKTDATGDDQGYFSGNVVYFNLGTGATATTGGELAVGASTTVKFKVQVNSGMIPNNTVITNTAATTYIGKTLGIGGGSFSTPSNVVKDTIVTIADLSVTKNANTLTPVVGDNITYTITVTNAGPDPATGTLASDLLQPGLSFISAIASQGAYNNGTGIWNLGLGGLAVGATATLTIVAQVTGPAVIPNTAQIIASDQKDPDSTPNNNNPAEDDQATVIVTPVLMADLSIDKSVNPENPNVGDPVTYTIVISNSGAGNATGVTSLEQIPPEITLISHSVTQGSYNPVTGVWNVGTINAGSSATLTILGTVNSAAQFKNIAAITHSDQPDPDNFDWADTVLIPQKIAELSLTKTAVPTNPVFGTHVTFTVTVTNAGPNTATDVKVTDALPAGLLYVSSTADYGNYNHTTNIWQIGNLPKDATATLTLTAAVNTMSPVWNLAEITNLHERDNNLLNNKDSVLVTPQAPAAPNLVFTKTDSTYFMPDSGATNTYYIFYQNTGGADFYNATITDTLPAGTNYLSCSGGTSCAETSFGSNIVTWNIGNIPAGGSGFVTVTVEVTASLPEYVNIAYFNGKDVLNNDLNYLASDTSYADTSSSGGVGGIESNSDMALKLFNRALRIESGQKIKMLAKNSPIMPLTFTLSELIPKSGPFNSTPTESTPYDILGISNATSSYAVDYIMQDKKSGRRIGTIFATTTNAPKIYDHTKQVCDRLIEGTVENIELVNVDGYSFYLAKIRREKEHYIDYSASFSIYETYGNNLTIESKWIYDDFIVPPITSNVYNFQIWSINREITIELLKQFLANLKTKGNIKYSNSQNISPDFVIRRAEYNHNGYIKIEILNYGNPRTVSGTLNYKINQGESQKQIPLNFTLQKGLNEFTIETGIITDAKVVLKSPTGFNDEVFVSGGAFTYSSDNSSIVNEFRTSGFAQNDKQNYPQAAYILSGGVNIKGKLKDYVTVLRSVRANTAYYDFGYNDRINFTASGTGKIQILIEMEGTKNYNYHTYTLTLSGSENHYSIPLNDFKERFGGSRALKAGLIKKVGFILEKSKNSNIENFDILFKDIAFTYNNVNPDQITGPNKYVLSQNYPNPFNPSTRINFSIVREELVTLKVYNILGQEVKVLVNEIKSPGNYSVDFNAIGLSSGMYIYRLQTDSYSETKKMMFIK